MRVCLRCGVELDEDGNEKVRTLYQQKDGLYYEGCRIARTFDGVGIEDEYYFVPHVVSTRRPAMLEITSIDSL